MKVLLWAAVLYLGGVATVLKLRPDIMFDKDGQWREFGFDSNGKTLFPFWLFCILWAVVSYAIAYFIVGGRKPEPIFPIQSTATIDTVAATNGNYLISEANRIVPRRGRRALPADLRPGYYMLNAESTEIDGVPRYIFIGAEAPDTSVKVSEDF